MTNLLDVKHLVKDFGNQQFCLGPISLALASGETLTILGKNGAGKSTFFKLVTGNLDPTGGEVNLFGQAMNPENFALKRRIGYLPQDLGLPRWVTGREILSYGCKLYGLASQVVTEQLGFWDCLAFADRPIASCSHGMQKRIGLGLAHIHNPDFLILDEPFSGLDLLHIANLKAKIRQRQAEGKATILCTHIAPYAAELAERAVLLVSGGVQELSDWPHLDPAARIATMESAFRAANQEHKSR